jgi:hypothetical protein
LVPGVVRGGERYGILSWAPCSLVTGSYRVGNQDAPLSNSCRRHIEWLVHTMRSLSTTELGEREESTPLALAS